MMGPMPGHARAERRAVCATLDRVGPAAPTLCTPWVTADLAAHLVVRERRPDAAAGIVVPALRDRTATVMGRYAARPWPELVDLVRMGPPRWSPTRWAPVDEAVNLVELFVHHEDVLRAGGEGPQREVPTELERALWSWLVTLGRVLFRRAGAGVVLVGPGHGRREVRPATAAGTVRLEGPPSELVLTAYGRSRVAAVAATGPPEAVALTLRQPGGLV
jgi:uncharacterized protein (TIGR03085 family)